MHRATGLSSSFRAFTGGGTRSAIDEIDDSKLMQEHSGNFMAGESRKGIEAPQNYGFTSVVMPAVKDALGKITDSAEAVISFMGGNRSFPVAGAMDDRRHRLFGLDHGDSAMFRTAQDAQQFHMSNKGTFWSTRNDRVNRIALVPPPQQQQQGGGAGGQAATRDGAAGGGGAAGGQSGGQQKGQKSLLDANQKSDTFIEQSSDHVHLARGNGHLIVKDNEVCGYYGDESISFRVTADHVHIRFKGNSIFVDKGGCWSSVPIQLAPDGHD